MLSIQNKLDLLMGDYVYDVGFGFMYRDHVHV